MSEPAPLRFSILLPVVRSPAMLPFAIRSVLAQTVADFELLVVCDGAPDATVACAREFAERDARVTCLPFPKGERHGEAHRHAALARATGRYVAHISDDDLWFPDHLAELETLLSVVDFGHTQPLDVFHTGKIDAKRVDLSVPTFRARLATVAKANRFGPTFAGYRMEAYRRLPEGWHPGPRDIPSDSYMWQKFLRRDDITAGTRMVVSALHFSSPMRAHMSPDERAAEVSGWFDRIQTSHGRAQVAEAAWRSLARQSVEDENLILSLDACEAASPFAENPEHRSAASKLARLTAAHEQVRGEIARISADADLVRRENARLSQELAARERHVRELQAALTGSQAEVARLGTTLSESGDVLATERAAHDVVRSEVARLDAALSESMHALSRVHVERDVLRGEVARIVGSRSWRWTSLFRRAMRFCLRRR